MKKITLFVLSLAIVFALVCPLAASASQYIPLWAEWGYDSLEEFLELMYMTEEEYYMLEEEYRRY